MDSGVIYMTDSHKGFAVYRPHSLSCSSPLCSQFLFLSFVIHLVLVSPFELDFLESITGRYEDGRC